jgi:hypothetical protein
MARHFKIDDVLAEEDREAFRDLLRKPSSTIDGMCDWLAEHGYEISRTAVRNYRTNFNEVLEGVRRSSEMARDFVNIAKNAGGADLAGASLSRFQQLLMEKLMSLSNDDEDGEGGGGLDAGELMKLSIALKTAVGAQQGIEELKADYQKRFNAEAGKLAGKHSITQEDIDVVRKAVFG